MHLDLDLDGPSLVRKRTQWIVAWTTALAIVLALLPSHAAQAVARNVAYTQMYDQAFGAGLDGHTRVEQTVEAPRTGDDGLVVARFYIPGWLAGARYLMGDNRGPNAAPNAASRVTVVWDVGSGQVQAISHPTVRSVDQKVYPAKRWQIMASAQEATHHIDTVPLYRNQLHVARSASGPTAWIEASVAAVNSATGETLGAAWSVNGTVRIARNASGGYSVRWHGTGYPAQEFYYYPKSGPVSAHLLALREIDPRAMNGLDHLFEPSGGWAAAMSHWADCLMPNPYSMSCSDDQENCNEWVTSWDRRGEVIGRLVPTPQPGPSPAPIRVVPGAPPTPVSVATPNPTHSLVPPPRVPVAGCVGVLRATNFPAYSVRAVPDRDVVLAKGSEVSSWASFRLRAVPGLINGSGISLESMATPGYYLRHEGGVLKLAPFDPGATYRADATFYAERPSATDRTQVALRSANYPDHYVRHLSGVLVISARNDHPGTPFDDDRTFRWGG